MTNLLVGLLILAGLVGLQLGMRHFTQVRLQRAWNHSQEAIQAGDLDIAASHLEKCVRLAPLWLPGRRQLANVQTRRGRFEAAEAQLKMSADLQPKQAPGHLELGLFYALHMPDRTDEALTAIERGIACDPQFRSAIATNPAVQRLRDHPRFQALIANPETVQGG